MSAEVKKYKLIYFNFMGIAEPVRLLFALAEVPYEDERIPEADWASVKKGMPWGCVPVLEWQTADGKCHQLSQSLAILRFLGRQFNRGGGNPLEMAKCEEYVEAMSDIVREFLKVYFEKDETRKAEMSKRMEDEVMPPFLSTLSSILKANRSNSNGFLVGSGVTYADLYVAHMMSRMQIDSEELKEKYPEIVAHRDLVFGIPSVKAYIEKRPVTPI